MRAKYLIALEDERFDDLPGRAYARAFLRTYAAALGLDDDRIVASFEEQVPEPEDPAPPRPRRRSRPGWAPLAGAGLAALFALVVWTQWSNRPSAGPVGGDVPAAAVAAVKPAVHAQSHVRAAAKTVRAAPAGVVVVRALRGPCWVLARRGGATGAVLAERTLQRGQSLRIPAAKVWLRLGAPWNVEVHRGSRVLHGTSTRSPVNVVL